MKLKNAIKKLSKFGEVKNQDGIYWAEDKGQVVEFIINGRIEDDRNITCIRVRGAKDEDDIMTDYWGGVWCDNLSQAIRIARM